LDTHEDSWADIFRAGGRSYRAPNVVLYTGAVESACGFGQAAMGPFYCPGDEKVYLDLSFFQELRDRFHAPGDFAQAYVIAHEVGHHVQNLLGISKQVESVRSRASEAEANRISVKLELQADCLAGVWANHTEKAQNSQAKAFLDPGDVEEALQAASMIGDDKLQKRSQGYVVPESFTTRQFPHNACNGSGRALKPAILRPATPSTDIANEVCSILLGCLRHKSAKKRACSTSFPSRLKTSSAASVLRAGSILKARP
jgi:predicted metalloprotease